jgi:hypothetical protein
MRLLAAATLFIATALPAFAQLAPPASSPITVPTAPKKAEPNEADLQMHGHYVNKAGQVMHSSAKGVDGKVQAGARGA